MTKRAEAEYFSNLFEEVKTAAAYWKLLKKTPGTSKFIIIDIYPGGSTHPKVVFREVMHPIELEFGSVDF